jgi:acyl-coenzyme A synthetase/AMP-(fatty) acid ligase
MSLEYFVDTFHQYKQSDAIVWQENIYTYSDLLTEMQRSSALLKHNNIAEGTVVMLEADFSPVSIGMLFALIQHKCIIAPIADATAEKKKRYRDIAQIELSIRINDTRDIHFQRFPAELNHPILNELRARRNPGLILFTSGSTGESKAIVHDFSQFLAKFQSARHRHRTLNFLLFDHVAGLNTMFYTLATGGCVITLQDRSPEAVCAAIEKYKVQLLPTSPTFINLLLFSEAYKRYDLSSLEIVTYGTEVMPQSTLHSFIETFPDIKIFQQFGATEIGVPKTRSEAKDSVWVRLGGDGFQTRVVDGMLEIKSPSAMLGYLNAPSPFTEDGWFKTGDSVEVNGEYYRILGRKSEIINVGGEKVYPAEVENTILSMDGVSDVTVTGESHPLTGNIVKAYIQLNSDESLREFRKRLHSYCQDKLLNYQIPQKIQLVSEPMHSERFKKNRREVESP